MFAVGRLLVNLGHFVILFLAKFSNIYLAWQRKDAVQKKQEPGEPMRIHFLKTKIPHCIKLTVEGSDLDFSKSFDKVM